MSRQADNVAQRLNAVLAHQTAETDGHLLERFVRHREAEALEALVHRHGGMVWGVCHRILHNHQDAEDAFQAAFLILVRKAASVFPREMVGNWLYGVARQTAMKARAMAAKRRTRERQVADMPEPAARETVSGHDVRLVLDQALGCLPDKYRVAIVLCDLEGRTRTEAARLVGCPEGTLAARLTRGRVLLTKRLHRLGWPASVGALTAVLSEEGSACVPVEIVSRTIASASRYASGLGVPAGFVSPALSSLTEGVLKAMWMNRLKTGVMSLLVAGALGLASGMVMLSMTSAGDGVPKPAKADEKARAGEDSPRVSIHYLDGLSAESRDKSQDIRFLDNGCHISLLLTNTTKNEIHLWKPNCPEGDDAIRLEFKRDAESKEIGIARTSHHYTGGMGIPKTMKLVPGDSLVFRIDFSSYWSLPFVLKPGAQADLLVRAVYESKPIGPKRSPLAPNADKVWDGRIETKWERVHIVNVTDSEAPKGHRGVNLLK